MKQRIKTREELIKDVAVLEEKVAEQDSWDSVRRKNLSKMLREPEENYPFAKQFVDTFSWPEIYFEVGKLKARMGANNLKNKLQALDEGLRKLDAQVNKPEVQ